MSEQLKLNQLEIGKTATVVSVGGEGALRQHFLDMGLIPDADVTLVKYAPMGDPMELSIHGYELTLRLDDAKHIVIKDVRDEERMPKLRQDYLSEIEHPGLGEGGRYHVKAGENPLPDGETLTFALAGNQNCGKTTLFNQLTGPAAGLPGEEQMAVGEKVAGLCQAHNAQGFHAKQSLGIQKQIAPQAGGAGI